MLPWILSAAFLVAQTIALIFVWIIRYHFKQFSVPGDPRGRRIVRVMTVGTLALLFASGAALIPILM